MFNVCVRLSTTAKNLGFTLDSTLDFQAQITKLKQSCFHKLRNIAKMKRFLSMDQMKQLVQAIILSSLDYCNSLYFGCSSSVLKQLQLIQNRACAVVLGLKRSDSKTENLKKLHWLRVKERIQFKILLITYKALNGEAPQYISELINYRESGSTRHAPLQTYVAKTPLGDRAFISCARLCLL